MGGVRIWVLIVEFGKDINGGDIEGWLGKVLVFIIFISILRDGVG